jgi:hypothetical protein
MKNKNKKFGVLKNGFGLLAVSGAVFTSIGMGVKNVDAHGVVGDYFFPPTITTDDPFAVDELALPTVSYFKEPAVGGGTAVGTTTLGFEFDKEIFPKFALGISGDYLFQKPDGQELATGWDNFSLSAKYQLWQNDPHQAIVSVGGEWEIGGSGSSQVGAGSANVFIPKIFYGKAFGDLPDSLKYARPIAVTGTLGVDFPTSAEPNNLRWDFALEYNLPYLDSHMKGGGLPRFFRNMIPLVEFSMTSPLNRSGGQTAGTINPGILYETKYFQIGAEALIPVNSASGHQVGGIMQLQLFIDDIIPKVFGFPLIGHDSEKTDE